ncbi:MAG: hypothetical protein R3F65_30450 [bacterium]
MAFGPIIGGGGGGGGGDGGGGGLAWETWTGTIGPVAAGDSQ